MVGCYQHSPLISERWIRVLDLPPSLRKSAQIHCKIHQIPFDEASKTTSYEALSYVWGSAQGTIPIQCNGKQLLVTQNCYDALIRLRLKHRSRTLWIDAICIDQSKTSDSTRERNHQVKLIGEIYYRSSRVIVWLGMGNESTPACFRAASRLGKLALWTLYYPHSRLFLDPLVKRGFDRLSINANTETARQFNKWLDEFIEHPWFTRVWTFQESVFARRCVVICAHSSMSWHAFLQIIVEMNIGRKGFQPTFERVLFRDDIRDLISDDDEKIVFCPAPLEWEDLSAYQRRADVTMLTTLGYLRSTLPHDRLYAFYAVFRSIGIDLPDPDYGKPLADAFGEMVKAFIRSRKKLTILGFAGRLERTDGLPSWIPDFLNPVPKSLTLDNTGSKFLIENDGHGYRASKESKAILPKQQPPNRLIVRGKYLGRIKRRYAAGTDTDDDTFRFMATFRDWCLMINSISTYPTGEEPLAAFARTVLFPLQESEPPVDSLLDVFSACFRLTISPERVLKDFERMGCSTDEDTPDDHPGKVLYAFLAWTTTREDKELSNRMRKLLHWISRLLYFALCLLDSGYLCVAFHHCREGDEVFLLAGSNCPMVLRPHGNEYKVVANAYVHGVMGGEMWPDTEDALQEVVLI